MFRLHVFIFSSFFLIVDLSHFIGIIVTSGSLEKEMPSGVYNVLAKLQNLNEEPHKIALASDPTTSLRGQVHSHFRPADCKCSVLHSHPQVQ